MDASLFCSLFSWSAVHSIGKFTLLSRVSRTLFNSDDWGARLIFELVTLTLVKLSNVCGFPFQPSGDSAAVEFPIMYHRLDKYLQLRLKPVSSPLLSFSYILYHYVSELIHTQQSVFICNSFCCVLFSVLYCSIFPLFFFNHCSVGYCLVIIQGCLQCLLFSVPQLLENVSAKTSVGEV